MHCIHYAPWSQFCARASTSVPRPVAECPLPMPPNKCTLSDTGQVRASGCFSCTCGSTPKVPSPLFTLDVSRGIASLLRNLLLSVMNLWPKESNNRMVRLHHVHYI